MIIRDEAQLTEAVLAEAQKTADPRLRELLTAFIRHLHGFAREVRLTEREFDQVINLVTALGHKTTESHNETRLIAGSLGLSMLVCLMNNGNRGARSTSANLLGPFWRAGAPRMPNGASIVRSPTPGRPLFFTGRILDQDGRPVAGAEIDVWHASPDGLYENQDPRQAEWNLRGRFTSDANGMFTYRSVKPAGYPVPMDGPTGKLLTVQGRHPFRPAHMHSLIYKAGFKTMTSQIYSHDDPLLESDAQFGVTETLVGQYVLHQHDPAPDADVQGPWYSLEHEFVLEPGEAWLPTPPVSAKKRSTNAEPA